LVAALRPVPGKDKVIIFDFVDVLNPVLKTSAVSRSYTYQKQNIKIKALPKRVS